MTANATTPEFWDTRARAYAASPVSNIANYEDTLSRTRRYLTTDMDVIELGCGTGSTALKLAGSAARYTGTDYAPEMIRIADEKLAEAQMGNLGFETAGLGRGDFDGCQYDAVLAYNLLHLIPDVPAALAEIRGMLPTGGLFMQKSATLGGRPDFRLLIGAMKLFGKAPSISYFKAKQFDGYLRDAGFEMVDSHVYKGFAPTYFTVARAV